MLDKLIAATAIVYGLCTVAVIPVLAAVDWTKIKPKDFSSPIVLFVMGLETVYSAVWVLLAVVWLIWFAMVLDWARARQIEVPGTFAALASWVACGVNFIYPYLVLRRVALGASVRTPLAWWWSVSWIGLLLALYASTRLMRGGYDPFFIVASTLELVSLYWAWRIPWDFRKADQAWDPRAALAQRA